MSELIKHECGIAMVRLLKPLEYYQFKYGTWRYGMQKLYLLMEKQHNRGQDGAGVVSLKLDQKPGTDYLHRQRSNEPQAIEAIFRDIYSQYSNVEERLLSDAVWAKQNLPFAGEVFFRSPALWDVWR